MKFMAVLLAAVLVSLMPLAHGSPIDPSTPGFWDNGDSDDVILFLTAGLHLLDTVHRPPLPALGTVSDVVVEHRTGTVPPHAHESGTPRAPPAA